MYQVTPAANAHMPRNYGELCGCLIQAVGSTQTLELEGLLVEMGRELGSSAGTARQPSAAMSYLEERGYFPSLEENEGMIILQFANCPYLEVVQGAPALCQFDRALVEALFGGEVEMLGRIVDREPVCTFQISS